MLKEAVFFPPLKIGHKIVAFKVSFYDDKGNLEESDYIRQPGKIFGNAESLTLPSPYHSGGTINFNILNYYQNHQLELKAGYENTITLSGDSILEVLVLDSGNNLVDGEYFAGSQQDTFIFEVANDGAYSIMVYHTLLGSLNYIAEYDLSLTALPLIYDNNFFWFLIENCTFNL